MNGGPTQRNVAASSSSLPSLLQSSCLPACPVASKAHATTTRGPTPSCLIRLRCWLFLSGELGGVAISGNLPRKLVGTRLHEDFQRERDEQTGATMEIQSHPSTA
jgi:hypothetical protein